jgi:hypothetical protein
VRELAVDERLISKWILELPIVTVGNEFYPTKTGPAAGIREKLFTFSTGCAAWINYRT